MTGRSVLVVSLVAVLGGCSSSPPFIECLDDTSCGLAVGGHCLANPATGHEFCAYPDPNCPTGFRWSDYDVEDPISGMCMAEPDAGVDAPASPAFDIVYPSSWRFSVPGPADSFAQIVNTSSTALHLGSFAVRSIDDDHPTAYVRVTATPSSATLPPGIAGGKLTPLAEAAFAGLVTEPRGDTGSSYLTIELLDAPVGAYDIHAALIVTLDGLDVALPMTIHVVPGPVVYLDPEAGDRVRVFR